MLFGYSVGDAVLLVQLAWKTVLNSRKACGEHDDLTSPGPSTFGNRDLQVREPNQSSQCTRKERTAGICRRLEKYNTLSEKERSAKKTWQRVRFGNGELANMRGLTEKLTYYISAPSLFVNMISMGSVDRVEQQIEYAGGDIEELQVAVNGMTAHLLSARNRDGSVLTTYPDDDSGLERV